MYPSMYCCMALIISLGIDEAKVFDDCECFAGQTDCQGLDLLCLSLFMRFPCRSNFWPVTLPEDYIISGLIPFYMLPLETTY